MPIHGADCSQTSGGPRTSDVLIREAMPQDAARISSYYDELRTPLHEIFPRVPGSKSDPQDIRAAMVAGHLTAVIATAPSTDRCLGLAQLNESGGGAAELTLTVHQDWRGQGVGRALMRAIENLARASGISQIALHVLLENTVALALYRSMGFRRAGSPRLLARKDGRDIHDLRLILRLDERRNTSAH